MKLSLLFLLSTLIMNTCAAQQTQPSGDSTALPPGTIRIHGYVKKLTRETATVIVTKVIASGSGIITPLSSEDEVHVKLSEHSIRLTVGETIEADVKEELGVDASQSLHVVSHIKKIKR
jgi:hypothetical protein